MSGEEFIFFLLVAIGMIVALIFNVAQSRRRRMELLELAARLGFNFRPEKDESFAAGWGFLSRLAQGTDRYASNILDGQYQGRRVFVFDYHYQTGSGKSAQQHYVTFFILVVQEVFPQLTIGSESFFSRLAGMFGFEDINFESAEFSRAFCVRSKDKKFAYDVCNAQMMEYLLANRDLEIEIQGPAITLAFGKLLSAQEIEFNLNRLVEIRSLMPEYLFAKV